MSKLTEILKLFCYDPETDGANTFNIPKALNENWEKIDAALAPLGGATTAQAALAALGAGVRPNLLDNAIFIGGGTGYGTFPVNQKGRLSGNTDRQFICDRWNQFGSDWSLTKDGLVISKRSDAAYWSFFQLIPVYLLSQLVGKTVTVSVLLDRVLATATQVLASPVTYFSFENGERAEIYIPDDDTVGAVQYYGSTTTRTVKAIKFEIGAAQTLAYQGADGAWRLLPQPESDYATQLAKCQAYYWESDGWFSITENDYITVSGENKFIKANIRFPVSMNRIPTVTILSANEKTPGILSDWQSGIDTEIQAVANPVSVFQSGFESIYSPNWVNGNYTFRVIANAEL